MKKYLVVLAAAFLVMTLASPSFAQFKSWGHLEVETIWQNNATYFDSDKSDNRRHVAERFRFYLQYGDPKTVRAVIGFEADASQFGEVSQASISTTLPAGSTMVTGPSTASRNKIGALATDQAGLEIKHAYMDFVVPGTPVGITAGLFNVAVGGSLGRYFLNLDVPGVKVYGAFAPHTIEAIWYKAYKQDAYKDNDADMYMLRYLLSQKLFSVEAWAAYELDRRTQIESWSWSETASGSGLYYLKKTLTSKNYDTKRWWIGAHVPISAYNFTITPTFIYQFGDQKKYFTGTGTTDVSISAWLANLEVKYQIGPGLSVTAQGYYSTGGDSEKNDKYTLYSVPNLSEAINVFGNGWSVFYFENTELTYYGHKREAFGGFWLGRLTVTYSPFAWLELQPSFIYIGDTSKGGDSATASYNSNTGLSNNTIGRRVDYKDESYVGSELNIIATVKIYDNLRYKIGFGYFLPGGAYDKFYADKGADNAWNLLTNLNYAF
jgi:hypothetical protein